MKRKEKALLIAIGANLFLVALKFFLAGISGSMAFGTGAFCLLSRFRRVYSVQQEGKPSDQGNQSNRKCDRPAHLPFRLLSGLQNVHQDDRAPASHADQCPHRHFRSDFGREHLLFYGRADSPRFPSPARRQPAAPTGRYVISQSGQRTFHWIRHSLPHCRSDKGISTINLV